MEDVYKTPRAELIVGDTTGDDFYIVSKSKCILLLLLTIGLYQYYWFYKNWQLQKLKTGESIRPVWRSIFAIFFIHSLFNRVDYKKIELRISEDWHPNALATFYIIFSILLSILNRLSANSIGVPYTSVSFIPFLFLHCYIVYRAQFMINLVCGDADGIQNNRYTPMNSLWIVIGLLFWFMLGVGLVATFYPDAFK